MKRTKLVTPTGLTVTLKGDLRVGAYLVRDSAREYLVSIARPQGLREPPRIERILKNGSLEVMTEESGLPPETWTKKQEEQNVPAR